MGAPHNKAKLGKLHLGQVNPGLILDDQIHLEVSQQTSLSLLRPKTETKKSNYLLYYAQCLKITEKVAFNIASEASYGYILSGQKFIKNAKNGQFGEFLKNSNSVSRQVTFNRTKIGGKCQN